MKKIGFRPYRRQMEENLGDKLTEQLKKDLSGNSGMTTEELDEFNRKKKNRINATGRERWAMIRAAIEVYGPMLLIVVLAFCVSALLMYFFLK